MATNFVQEGTVLDLAAPYDRTAGQGALIGARFGVALNTVLSAATGQFMVEGVFDLTKTSAQAWVLGDRIYWDDSNKRCDNDPTVGPLIGVAVAVAANPSTTGRVRLNESVPGLEEAKQQAQVSDLTDNGGGATADGTIAAVTAPTAQTDSSGGVANATLSAQTLPTSPGAGADGTTPSGAQWTAAVTQLTVLKAVTASYAARQAENRAAIVALTDAVKELSTKQNAVLAALRLAGIIKT